MICLVEGGGFEPPKSYDDRFTVCSLWPLGNPSTRPGHHPRSGWALPRPGCPRLHPEVRGTTATPAGIAFSRPCQSGWSWRWDLNPQPADYKSAALPVELRQQRFRASTRSHGLWQEEKGENRKIFFFFPRPPRPNLFRPRREKAGIVARHYGNTLIIYAYFGRRYLVARSRNISGVTARAFSIWSRVKERGRPSSVSSAASPARLPRLCISR